jgi:hypothetical protein
VAAAATGVATAATSPSAATAAGRKVLTGDPVPIPVEVVGIAGFEVFLSFTLRSEVGAIVIDGTGRPGGEQRNRGCAEEK